MLTHQLTRRSGNDKQYILLCNYHFPLSVRMRSHLQLEKAEKEAFTFVFSQKQ